MSKVILFLMVLRAADFRSAERAAEALRLVAVGDIHGDFDAFVAMLRQARLVDANNEWIGGNATLVQTGDFMDRGPKTRQVMDLLMALEKGASRKGGRVVVLLGNHEAMNIFGDLRYVTTADYAAFVDGDSEKRRREAYQSQLRLSRTRAARMRRPEPRPSPEDEAQWMKHHPPGFVERQQALRAQGRYGRWLRQREAVARVDGSVFLHGGISPEITALSVTEINRRVSGEIRVFDRVQRYMEEHRLALPFFTLDELTKAAQEELEFRRQNPDPAETTEVLEEFLAYPRWLSVHPAGPLWFRGYAQWTDEECTGRIAELLRAYKAERFVVGHTPQSGGRIRSRLGGQVLLIDTGMLSSHYSGGRPSALEISGKRVTALYLDEQTVLSGINP